MTERLPSHNFDWFALLEIGFVPADIWISWFGPFAFVKPSLSHLRVLELECWISPETSFVFSMSNHPHFYLVQGHRHRQRQRQRHLENTLNEQSKILGTFVTSDPSDEQP